jgi:transposase InsO family protein
MDQRVQFIAEWLKGEESRAMLCRRYGISRKTGYQLAARYAGDGERAFAERSRAPHRQALAMPAAVEAAVLAVRARHPRWGPRKLRAWLSERQPGVRWPVPSTIGALLRRQGLTIPRRRRVRIPAAPPLGPDATRPNARWSADFKGWFVTGDGARCQPFTLADYASRFLLRCQSVPAADEPTVRPLFEAAFREYGLPAAILTDNGPPFVTTGIGGLSHLAIWWIKLGIQPERTAPGHPEQNGRHERMHLTLAEETTQPPQATVRAQQRAFQAFRHVYNHERPHEALGQRPPARVYEPSAHPYPERLPEPEYAPDIEVRRVRHNGALRWHGQEIYLGQALARELIGLEELIEDCWRVRFGPVTLAWLDSRGRPIPPTAAGRARAAMNPDLLPMCPV